MPDQQTIYDSIAEYTVDQLIQFIQDGVVTYDELCDFQNTNGEFSLDKRTEVQRRLQRAEREAQQQLQRAEREAQQQLQRAEDNDWTNAKNSPSIEKLQNYLTSYPGGRYRDNARNLLNGLRANQASMEIKSSWDLVDKKDIDKLKTFREQHPESIYDQDASQLITRLERNRFLGPRITALSNDIRQTRVSRGVIDQEIAIFQLISNYLTNEDISKEELMSVLRNDNNFVSSTVISQLINNEKLTPTDLLGIGIDNAFIAHLYNNNGPVEFDPPRRPLERITKTSTEIYFWGIPSSGKSCAIGSILSAASNGQVARTMQQDPNCQGYGYMNRLAALFETDEAVGTLPKGTTICSTYEMGFDLVDNQDKTHPITCIDLAGELFLCMYKKQEGVVLTNDQSQVLETLTNILVDRRTQNRKIHFFVIEYGAENRTYGGLTQATYLNSAVAYIKQTGIFEKDTDGIYLLISKVDKANADDGNKLEKRLRNYIRQNYLGFYNSLKYICRICDINGGRVEIVPFSLGKVCFQDYCQFQTEYASRVVSTILMRARGFKTGKWSRFLNFFRK